MSERKPRESFSLRTDDIAGAKPCLKSYQFLNKPCYINSTQGIDKSTPHIPDLNSSRQVNPLSPNYKLPSYVPRPVTPPKYIRDSMNITDIAGATPKNSVKQSSRNSLDISDICPKTSYKKTARGEKIDLKAINGTKFESQRTTNPLSPEYMIRDKDNKLVRYGDIAGSGPRNLINCKTPPHNRSLDVSDIQGKPAQNTFIASEFDKIAEKQKTSLSIRLTTELLKKVKSHDSISSTGKISTETQSKSNFSVSKSFESLNDKNCGKITEKRNGKQKMTNKKAPIPRSPIFSPKAKKK
jgi:hypothetical protein